MLRSLARSLLIRQPATSRGLSSVAVDSGNENEEEISFEKMKASPQFVKKLPKKQREKYEKALREFEIFFFLGKYTPTKMTERDWMRTIECESLNDKIGFWEYLAVTERRKSRKEKSQSTGAEIYKAYLAEQQKIYDEGGMGYGPEMYQLISNPLRNQKRVNNCQGARVFSSMKSDAPRIALDLQYIEKAKHREVAELGNQMQYVISENFSSKNPLVMDFVNAPSEAFLNEWLAKSVGYYTSTYTNQTILPDFSTKGIKDTCGKGGKMIYLSPHARDVLDGPLNVDVIGVCVSMGKQRDALSAARREEIRAFRLPIHRYVKWKSGPQFLPFPNMMNVIREVHASGGDWATALHNNISKRHLIDPNEDERKMQMTLRRKAREEERRELTEAIICATQD